MVALGREYDAGRARAERITQLAPYLQPHDRDLLLAVYARGVAVSELARALKRRPRTLQRRLRALVRRLAAPEFAFIAAHHETWPALRRHVASMVLLQRRPNAEVARILRISRYALQRELIAISILVEQARAMSRLRGNKGTESEGRRNE